MKRWWLILAVIATFFVGDRVGALVIQQLMDRSPQRFCQLYAGKLKADIVCIGNSRGVITLSAPQIAEATRKTVANISFNGMPVQIARALFADYLDHNPAPKLLVIESSFVTVAVPAAPSIGKGVVGEYKPFWGHSSRLRELGERYCPDVVDATRVTRLYQFNSELCLRSLYFLLLGRGDQNASMAGKLSSALVEQVERMAPFELTILPDDLEALRGMIADAHEAGVEVKLVFAPYMPQYAQKITNLDEVLRQLAEGTGLQVVDLSRALDDTNMFADRVHVNPAGTREMTKLMVERGVFN